MIPSQNRRWFALYTKPKHEFKAETMIESFGIKCFLPKIIRTKQWSDRKKKISEPLFKGYIFIYADEKERFDALELPPVVSTVSFGGKPVPVPDWQIDTLRKMLDSNEEIIVENSLKEGTPVTVSDGPFEGVKGIVMKVDGKKQMLAVNIDILKRTVLIRLPVESVSKIGNSSL